MRNRANAFLVVGAVALLQALLPAVAAATDEHGAGRRSKQAGEDRWVPSFAILSGVTVQEQHGSASSFLQEGASATPIVLQPGAEGHDTTVSAFVGASLELMSPALPIPTRPRFFVSAEILPTFGADRDLALDGDPNCVRGPLPNDPCASEEDGTRRRLYDEEAINGEGSKTTATVDTLAFGATAGIAFPLQFGERQIRIKPLIGWINYKVEAEGLVVDAECPAENPLFGCTAYTPNLNNPPIPGFLREVTLTGKESKRFNGIGPGLDVEVDTARVGPVGAAIFLGARAYYVPGDRRITFGTTETFDDVFGNDVAFGNFEVKVDPWIYQAHIGIRFLWLGTD
jgi:hypothetical protein